MKYLLVSVFAIASLGLVQSATAKDALCFTTDDGEFPCSFEKLDEAGSFRITAPGKPSFELWIEGEGQGFASAVFEPGGRSIALPGTYFRSQDDGACWISDATETAICAW